MLAFKLPLSRRLVGAVRRRVFLRVAGGARTSARCSPRRRVQRGGGGAATPRGPPICVGERAGESTNAGQEVWVALTPGPVAEAY